MVMFIVNMGKCFDNSTPTKKAKAVQTEPKIKR